jgi:DNA-binding NarL/FixJ family response regulator
MELRVFLVDDLVTMRSLVEDLLSTIGGLRLVDTANGEGEAKVWLDDHRGAWDLAIVDLVLDQGSGMGVISHAKAVHPEGTIVVFSAFATPGIESHCRRLGADAVFNKTHTRDFVAWLQQQRPPT